MFVGDFTASFPPAARTLAVSGSVYAIMAAAKKNTWVSQKITGWYAVALNLAFTITGLVIVIPADQLYSTNSMVSIVVGVLGSSGIHGMSKAIPASQAKDAEQKD